MEMWPLPRRLVAFALLTVLLLTTMAPAHQGVPGAGVQRRMNTMIEAQRALATLGKMANGRATFDTGRARTARRDLVTSFRTLPRRFRKNHDDPASHARPEIWVHWDDFTTRAGVAKRAARSIRVNSLSGLKATLPRMLAACLDCHKAYRLPDG